MAETITVTVTDADETITVTIDEAARGPAGTTIDSYVSDIESLPDYPTSFPTTPADISNVGHDKLIGRHGAGTGTAQEIGIDGGLELQGGNLRRAAITGPVTVAAGGSVSAIADGALTIAMTSGLQTILNGSTGGNGIADAGKLVKFGSSGQINVVGDALNPALYGSSDVGDAVVGYSTDGTGMFASSVNGAGGEFSSDSGVYHAKFGYQGNDRSAIERVRGWFVWFYSSFIGRLKTADITADREWTLPNATGTIALLEGRQTFTSQIELSGQAATSATSAMTRGLCDTRYARAWGAALSAGVNSDTNTTTYKTVTELSFALDVGTYYIDAVLLHNGNASYATSGVKDRINFTGTATAWGTLYRVLDNATTSTSVPTGIASSSPIAESAPTTRSQTTWRKGVLTVTAAGTLQVQIAQSVAVAAANTTLAAGSSISIVKLT